jgi:hypothetical protein
MFCISLGCLGFRFEKGNQFKRLAKLIDKNGKIDMNLAWQRVKDATNRRRNKRRIVKERLCTAASYRYPRVPRCGNGKRRSAAH